MKLASYLFGWLTLVALPLAVKGADQQGSSGAAEATCTVDGSCSSTTSDSYDDSEYNCDLYLAESSIPTAGWGLYTGRSLQADEALLPHDVAIHVIDYEANYEATKAALKDSHKSNNDDDDEDELPDWPMNDYKWVGSITWHEFDAADVKGILPGIGMLVNSFPSLANLDAEGCRDRGGDEWNNSILAGASTDCQQTTFSTNQRLPAGHELFLDYGEDWFLDYHAYAQEQEEDDEDDDEVDVSDVALSEDYEAVDALLMEWEHDMSGDLDSPEAVKAYKQLRASISKPARRNLLPVDAKKAVRDLVYGRHHTLDTPYFPLTTAHAQLEHFGIRSADWLQKNGMCVDGIVTRQRQVKKTTTTTAAGKNDKNDILSSSYGAFSKRPIKKGAVVMPVPVMHLSREHLKIHTANNQNNTQQLLLNYCYGHEHSSLLLFPYAPGVNLINHAGSGTSSTPNVAVRWAQKRGTNPLKSANEWLQMTAPEVLELNDAFQTRHLLLELYAIKDIAAGEELLLDYGPSWVKAWEEHVAKVTKSKNKQTRSLPPAGFYDKEDEIYTLAQDPDKYPHHIQVRCWVERELLDSPAADDAENLWYSWNPTTNDGLSTTEPCTVLSADIYDGEKSSYRIVLEADDVHVKDVPWSAITFVEYPYRSAQFAPTAFRHEIGVPDDLYPEQWKDLKPKGGGRTKIEKKVPSEKVQKSKEPKQPDKATVKQASKESAKESKESEKAQKVASESNQKENAKPKETVPEQKAADRQAAAASKKQKPISRSTVVDPECGLYMAESAIPNSGLGMFTARPIAANASIFYGDLVINVEDFGENMRLRQRYLKRNDTTADSWLLDSYFWNAALTFALYEAEEVKSIVPGLGMLANSHPGLINALMVGPQHVEGLHRGRDPGAGASTTYHNITFFARKQAIEAGGELFVEYGDEWFEERTNLGFIALSRQYDHADEILDYMFDEVLGKKLNNKLAKKVWELINITTQDSPRLRSALPKTLEDVTKVRQAGGTAKFSVLDRVRSIEWLQQNGRCLDNIRPDASTIPQAGLGAFATRNLQKGTVVAPLPLVQLQRHHLEVYDTDGGEVDLEGYQLLLNYCYGHPESSLLLFPYAPVVNYVNHNREPNVQLQWSNHTSHHADWLERSPRDIAAEVHTGLILELVATRDIEAGEEVFLDYGDSWERSWRQHSSFDWSPDPEDTKYVSAAGRNAREEQLTSEDNWDESYENVFLACFVPTEMDEDDLKVDSDGQAYYEWRAEPEMFDDGLLLSPCEVIGHCDNKENCYDVRVEPDDGGSKESVFKNVPRHAIRFFDEQYSSDMFLRTSFRHEITIPDELFPLAWRDTKAVQKKRQHKIKGELNQED